MLSQRRREPRFALLALLATASCGGGSGGSDGGAAGTGGAGGGPSGALDFANRIVAATCQLLVACGDAPDETSCVASTLPALPWVYPTIAQDVADGKTVYSSAQASACLASYANPSCTETWLAALDTATNQTCVGVFTGTIAAGGACSWDTECAGANICIFDDTACDPTKQCCHGTCTASAPPIPVNGDCSNPSMSCVFGTFCDASGSPPTCVPLRATAGLPCTGEGQCAPPLFCDPGAGACAPPAAAGATCRYNVATSGESCDDYRDVCDAVTAKCLGPVARGAPCTSTTLCPGDTHCDVGSNTCVSYLAAGASCVQSPTSCLLDLVCDPVNSTCVLPSAAACAGPAARAADARPRKARTEITRLPEAQSGRRGPHPGDRRPRHIWRRTVVGTSWATRCRSPTSWRPC